MEITTITTSIKDHIQIKCESHDFHDFDVLVDQENFEAFLLKQVDFTPAKVKHFESGNSEDVDISEYGKLNGYSHEAESMQDLVNDYLKHRVSFEIRIEIEAVAEKFVKRLVWLG